MKTLKAFKRLTSCVAIFMCGAAFVLDISPIDTVWLLAASIITAWTVTSEL